jgi:tetratricopeptide (TPR) repeat protein
MAALAVLILFATPALAESPDEVYSFAEHLKRDNMFEAAAQQYLRFARENPVDRRAPDALVKAADCLVETNDTERAITVLEAVTETYPDNSDMCDIKLRLGRLYLKITRFEAADREFTDVVVTMPNCPRVPDAMLGKGEALVALTRYDAAIEVFSSLITNYLESPAAPRAIYHLAYCQRKQGRHVEALKTYQRICTDFPGDPLAGFASLEAARMFAERGDINAAIEFYKNAKRYETKVFFVPASMEGAELLREAGNYADALAWYEELLTRSDLDDPRTVYIDAAEAAYYAGQMDSVRRITDAYSSRFPKTFSPQITYITALTSLEKREFDSVLRDVSELETFAPGTEWARMAPRVRGDAMLEMGRSREAIVEWRRFVSLSQDSLARVETLGRMAEVQFSVVRDTTAALATLNEQLDAERRAIPAEMLRVAGLNEQARRYQGAHDLYADLVARFPLSSEAETAVARMEFLDEFAVTDYAAATKDMDRLAFEIARLDDWQGLIRVIEARINVTKDFEGALTLTRQLKNSAKKTDYYPRILYLEGLCQSKLAMMAHHTGHENTAKDRKKDALKPWNDLTKDFGTTEWAAQAATEKIKLTTTVDGVVDTTAVKRVLARYPDHADRGDLIEMLGNYSLDTAGDPVAAQRYYRQALELNRDDVRLRYKSAIALANNKKYDEAYQVFSSIAESDDGRFGLLSAYEAGRALRQLGRYDGAVKYFDRVAERDPAGTFGASGLLQAADCRFMQKKYEEALTRYRQAEKRADSDQRRWEVSYRIALCEEQTGENRNALGRLEKILVQPHGGSLRPRVYRKAADLASTLGETGRQVAILDAYVTEFTTGEEPAAASLELIRLYLQTGDTESASALAERVSNKAGGDDTEAMALLAMARYRSGRRGDGDKLRSDVEKKAGADSPLLPQIDVELAKYHYDQESFDQAAQVLKDFAEKCSGSGACEEGRYYYAVALMGATQTDRAVAASSSFFRDYPMSVWGPRLHLKLGNVLVRASRVSESLLHYQEAAETTADSTTAFLALKNLGITYQELKRWRDAERVWTQVLNRFPASSFAPEAALNLARCKMEYGDYRGAIAAYELSLPLLDSEARARAFYWMGTSYEQLGDFQSAVVQYLKVPYLARGGGLWVVTAELKAAECYAKIGRIDASKEIYNRVITKYGAGSNWGKLARKGLDGLENNGATKQSDTSTGGSN